MSRPVCVQRTGRGTEIAYKAQSPGKLAQHNKAQGSGDREPRSNTLIAQTLPTRAS
jgi:hypothetical protein